MVQLAAEHVVLECRLRVDKAIRHTHVERVLHAGEKLHHGSSAHARMPAGGDLSCRAAQRSHHEASAECGRGSLCAFRPAASGFHAEAQVSTQLIWRDSFLDHAASQAARLIQSMWLTARFTGHPPRVVQRQGLGWPVLPRQPLVDISRAYLAFVIQVTTSAAAWLRLPTSPHLSESPTTDQPQVK